MPSTVTMVFNDSTWMTALASWNVPSGRGLAMAWNSQTTIMPNG